MKDTTDHALNGIKVLDFSIMMAGPYCGRLMADLGADVIKIESPEGDDMRQRAPLRQGRSTYFGQLNAGKRSLALDLKCPEAIDLIRQLVMQADVVLENFRPGVMDRLGLGAKALRALNPRLVYCSISGYGQAGPASELPAYAMIVQAASGYEKTLMRYAGDRARPAATATFVADVLGGIYAFGAIQTALLQRERTGQAQEVDVALMDSMLNLLVYELQEAQFPVSSARPTYGPVSALDGDLLIVPITARNFSALSEVTGLAPLREDARFTSMSARNAHWTAMMQVVECWTGTRTVDECLHTLETAGVPCARYAQPADALHNDHLHERGLFTTVADQAGSFIGVNAPWQLSQSLSCLGESVPEVGEHTEEVLGDMLGMTSTEIAALRRAGTFGPVS